MKLKTHRAHTTLTYAGAATAENLLMKLGVPDTAVFLLLRTAMAWCVSAPNNATDSSPCAISKKVQKAEPEKKSSIAIFTVEARQKTRLIESKDNMH